MLLAIVVNLSRPYRNGRTPGGLPARFLLKGTLPFAFFLILLQGIAMALKSLLLVGFPVAFTLGAVSLTFGYFSFNMGLFDLMPLRVWGTTQPTRQQIPG